MFADNQIKIRRLKLDDYEIVLNWSKDEAFCLANGWKRNRTPEELYRWWVNCVNNVAEDFVRMGIIYNGKLIGYADLSSITDQSAELGIAIGESPLWGKGIGSTAAKCIINYGSENLGTTIFNAETHEKNIRSIKMLEKIGFREISRLGSEEYLGTECRLIQYQFNFGRIKEENL